MAHLKTTLRMRAPTQLALVLGLLSIACAASDPSHTGAGGTTGAGSGGTTGDSGGAGGAGTAGVGGTAGSAGSGAGGRGGSAGSPGTGGVTGGAGTTGSGGAGGGGAAPTPSAGCAKMAGRPANGVVTVTGDHIYNFPTSYDGKTPMPLLIALHAAGNPYTQLQGLTNGTRLETNFVRAFPKSAGTAWVLNTDTPRVTAVYNDLLANYCVDTSRVFATGHSSGAQMVVQLICAAGENRFKAVAPVAASRYCTMLSPIPVMYIQGMMDAMRGNSNGADVVAVFTKSNMCSTTTVPDTAVPTCNSTLDRALVTPGCVTYQGCTKPTIWCSHNDNSYNTTDGRQHGWPCFASNAMADFFLGLP